MKYTITLGGSGSESYVHTLNEEQLKNLKKLNIENPNRLFDEFDIANALNKNDFFETDNIFMGPYFDPKYYFIEVHDENENLIWESKNDHEFEDNEYVSVFDEGKILIIDEYIKGTYLNFVIEADNFDPLKLIPIITEVGERLEIITGFVYDGKKIDEVNEYLDYRSNGISYYLND